jgi:hypothetical protein
MKRPLLLIAATLALAASLSAAPPPWQVRVTFEIIGLDRATSFPLLGRLRAEQTAAAALRELDEMVSDGRAELIDRPSMLLGSNHRSACESTEEIRSGGERDIPHPPMNFEPTEQTKRRFIDQRFPLGGPLLENFQTRNLGATAEVEATVSEDGSRISLYFDSQCILLERMQRFVGNTDESGFTWLQQQPWFTTARLQTQLTLRSGRRLFLADFAAADVPRPRTIVFLVSASAQRIPPPASR